MTDALNRHVPALAAAYCYQLWRHYNFNFRIVKPRRTRLGDFRVFPGKQTQITVNANLNPYAFLITYVHEVAHAEVHRYHALQLRRRRIQPHGKEWQTAFQQLMQPLLTETVFPVDILIPLRQYMAHPGATTCANPSLMLALRQFDRQPPVATTENQLLLRDVAEGNLFQLAKKTYVRGTLRRTRIVCKEVPSGKSYAILAHAWVSTGINDE